LPRYSPTTAGNLAKLPLLMESAAPRRKRVVALSSPIATELSLRARLSDPRLTIDEVSAHKAEPYITAGDTRTFTANHARIAQHTRSGPARTTHGRLSGAMLRAGAERAARTAASGGLGMAGVAAGQPIRGSVIPGGWSIGLGAPAFTGTPKALID